MLSHLYSEMTLQERFTTVRLFASPRPLHIVRYVDTSEAVQEIDIAAVQGEIDRLEAELKKNRAEIDKHLRELGLVRMKEIPTRKPT